MVRVKQRPDNGAIQDVSFVKNFTSVDIAKLPVSVKPDRTTSQTTAELNCHRRACMYDCTTLRPHDHACSECSLLQVFTNALVVGRLGSRPNLLGRIGLGVRASDSFHILSCAVAYAILWSGFRET